MATSNVPAAVVTAAEPGALISGYAAPIAGQLGGFDRVSLTGPLLDVGHPAAVERPLPAANFRCFDRGLFAEPLRDALWDDARTRARDAGLEVAFLPRRNFRQADRLAALRQPRGDHPGLGPVFSARAPGPAFRPWPDKPSGRTGGKRTQGRCLHFDFHFVQERLGRG